MGLASFLSLVIITLVFYIGAVRKKSAGRTFYAASLSAIALALLFELTVNGVTIQPPHWAEVSLTFVAYLVISFAILKALDLLLIEDILIEKQGRYIPPVLRLIVVMIGVAIAGLILLRVVLEVDPLALIALPTVATAVIGFALKDVIARLVSGIQLGSIINIGDWVTVMEKEGVVTDIGFDYVTIKTRANDEITLPNDVIAESQIVNHSRPDNVRASCIFVRAHYAHPPMQVKEILVNSAAAVPGVVEHPAPFSVVHKFEESAIVYKLKFYLTDYANLERIEGEVRTYVWYAFQRHGIEIPFPQRVVHMTHLPDASSLRTVELAEIEDKLRAVDFLAGLDAQSLRLLAEQAQRRVYLPAEYIVREGEQGDEFFVVMNGDANVIIQSGNEIVPVVNLTKGQFFGEMSLLTGSPRSATVQAQSQLTVIVIGRGAMSHVLSQNPTLAKHFGEILTARQSELIATRESADRAAKLMTGTADGRSLTAKILKFFGLAS